MRGASRLPLVLLCLAAGCVTLNRPALVLHDYRLDYEPPSTSGTTLPVTLRVPPFGVAATYDRPAIVYRTDSYAIAAYYYHRWSAPPGQMVADLLARDLAASGLYRAVQQAPSPLPADYAIEGHIERLEERNEGGTCASVLDMRLSVLRLRQGPSTPVLLSQTYRVQEPTSCGDPTADVGGLSRALQHVSEEFQRDAYQAISAQLK